MLANETKGAYLDFPLLHTVYLLGRRRMRHLFRVLLQTLFGRPDWLCGPAVFVGDGVCNGQISSKTSSKDSGDDLES